MVLKRCFKSGIHGRQSRWVLTLDRTLSLDPVRRVGWVQVNLRHRNLALLAKWLLWFLLELNAFRCKVIVRKYGWYLFGWVLDCVVKAPWGTCWKKSLWVSLVFSCLGNFLSRMVTRSIYGRPLLGWWSLYGDSTLYNFDFRRSVLECESFGISSLIIFFMG